MKVQRVRQRRHGVVLRAGTLEAVERALDAIVAQVAVQACVRLEAVLVAQVRVRRGTTEQIDGALELVCDGHVQARVAVAILRVHVRTFR